MQEQPNPHQCFDEQVPIPQPLLDAQFLEQSNLNSEKLDQEEKSEKEQRLDDLVSMLVSSLSNNKESAIGVFLTKIHKHNTNNKQRKINQIRLSHLNIFFQKVTHKMPNDSLSVQLIYQIIFGLLKNEKNFTYDNQSEELYSTMVTIARVMQCTIDNTPFTNDVMDLLSYLTNNQLINLKIMSEKQFAQEFSKSEYFKELQLTQQEIRKIDLVEPEEYYGCGYSLLQPLNRNTVLKSLSITQFYQRLFEKIQTNSKTKVIDYFFANLKIKQELDQLKIYSQTFLTTIKDVPEELQAIIYGAENPVFDYQQMVYILHALVSYVSQHYSVTALSKIRISNYKCHQDFIHIAQQESVKMPLNNLIQNFTSQQQCNTYFMFYLIVKSKHAIPQPYICNLLFQDPTKHLTNRRAIVIALAIAQHPNRFSSIIEKFFQKEQEIQFSQQFRTIVLKVVHYALQSPSKASIFGQILKCIPANDLNNPTNFDFLPMQSIDKAVIDKEQNKLLLQFVKRSFDNVERSFKMKIDIYSLCGESMAALNHIRQAQKQFEKPIQEILRNLHTIPQKVLDAVLMGLNNKLQHHYIEQISQPSIDWIVKTYNKNWNSLQQNLQNYFRVKGNDKMLHLALAIMHYNEFKHTTINFQPYLEPIIVPKPIQIKGTQFSDYYIQFLKIDRAIQEMVKQKIILTQLRILLSYLTSFQQKYLNKKQVKAILMSGAENVFTLQIIHNYLQYGCQSINILEKVFVFKGGVTKIEEKDPQPQNTSEMFKPDNQFLENLQKKAQDIGQRFQSIIPHIPSLLKLLYPQTLAFIALVLQSQSGPSQPFEETPSKRVKGKKKGSKDTHEKEKMGNSSQNLISTLANNQNIDCLFAYPAILQSYENLFVIVDRILATISSNRDTFNISENQIAFNIARWLEGIIIFHCDKFEQWKHRVDNLTNMWSRVAPIFSIVPHLQTIISSKQFQRHFLILTDLLNTLYEKYRSQKSMLQVQQKLLLALCTIYNLSGRCNQQRMRQGYIEEQCSLPRQIPKSDLQNALIEFKMKNYSTSLPNGNGKDMRYYYCYSCQRSICEICSSFIHRVHDRTYTGAEGTCTHQQTRKTQNTPNQENIVTREREKQRQRQRQRVPRQPPGTFSFNSAYYRDQAEDILQRASQYDGINFGREDFQRQLRGNQPNFRQMLNERYGLRMERQTSIMPQMASSARRLEGGPNRPDISNRETTELRRSQSQGDIEEDDTLSIKSASEKSFQTYPYKTFENQTFMAAFGTYQTSADLHKLPHSSINLSPLSNLLLRQLQNQMFHCSEGTNQDQQNQYQQNNKDKNNPMTLVNMEVIDSRIEFFRSNAFKFIINREPPYGGGRQLFLPSSMQVNMQLRSVVTASKKYFAIAGPANVFIMNLVEVKKRFLRKQIQKNSKGNNTTEAQNPLKNGVINGLNFEVVQTVFSQYNDEFLALIGQSQIAFYQVNNEGRASRYLSHDFGTNQPIMKFMWVNEVKLTFAYGISRQIRLGIIAQGNKAKKLCQVTGPVIFRDFSIAPGRKSLLIYVLDTEGNIYRAEYNSKNDFIGLAGKQLLLPLFPDQITSILALKDKLLVTCKDMTCYLIHFPPFNPQKQSQQEYQDHIRSIDQSRITKFSLAAKMKELIPNNSALGSLTYPLGLRVLYQSDDVFSVTCLLRRESSFKTGNNNNNNGRRVAGIITVLQFREKNKLSISIFSPQFQVDSYEFTPLDERSYFILGMQQDGVLTTGRYSLPKVSSIKNQDLKITLNSPQCLAAFNKHVKANSYINKLLYIDSTRCAHFKEISQIVTDKFTIDNNSNNIIIKSVNNSLSFISGISLSVEPQIENSKLHQLQPIQLNFSFLGVDYKFMVKKSRDIHIPLTLKQTLFLFTNGQPVYIEFDSPVNFSVKKVQIYGEQWQNINNYVNNDIGVNDSNTLMVAYNPFATEPCHFYRQCLCQLKKLYEMYVNYPQDSLEHYLLNPNRSDLGTVKITETPKTFESKGYGIKETNLMLKMQLFAQCLPQSSIKYNSSKVQETIELTKNALLPFCEGKKYLQNSCKRLFRIMSGIYMERGMEPLLTLKIGYPFEYRTITDLFFMERYYNAWKNDKSISNYNKVLKSLSHVLTRRAVNLYIMMALFPSMIPQLSMFFKTLANQVRTCSTSKKEAEKRRISAVCTMLIALICEFYQLLKNTKRSFSSQSIEKIVLYLLQNIFCTIKKDFYKQIFLNPFQHLQKLRIPAAQHTNPKLELDCGISIRKLQPVGREDGQSRILVQKSGEHGQFHKIEQEGDIDNEVEGSPRGNDPVQNSGRSYHQEAQNVQRSCSEDEEDAEEPPYEQEKQMDEEQRLMEPPIQVEHIVGSQVKIEGAQNKLRVNQTPNKQAQIISHLLSACQTNSPSQTFTHYALVFELTISLFSQKNYINSSNVVFYMGLLFNLLRIIEVRMDVERDSQRIKRLCQKIDEAILEKCNSPLFLVLEYFVEPDYYVTRDRISLEKKRSIDREEDGQKQRMHALERHDKETNPGQFYKNCQKIIQNKTYMQSHPTRLCSEITKFYKNSPYQNNPILKIQYLQLPANSDPVSLNEVLTFTTFKIQNPIYSLKYLGNLYISLKRNGYAPLIVFQQPASLEKIKSLILSTVVKTQLRVYKNIMLYEGWLMDLESAKIDVGFERLTNEGVQMIYGSAMTHRDVFIRSMDRHPERIGVLEEMVMTPSTTTTKETTKNQKNQEILEILNMYYEKLGQEVK